MSNLPHIAADLADIAADAADAQAMTPAALAGLARDALTVALKLHLEAVTTALPSLDSPGAHAVGVLLSDQLHDAWTRMQGVDVQAPAPLTPAANLVGALLLSMRAYLVVASETLGERLSAADETAAVIAAMKETA